MKADEAPIVCLTDRIVGHQALSVTNRSRIVFFIFQLRSEPLEHLSRLLAVLLPCAAQPFVVQRREQIVLVETGGVGERGPFGFRVSACGRLFSHRERFVAPASPAGAA
jgi:hypothetical protein